MNRFEVGEKVSFLYEAGSGVILEITGLHECLVEDENKFVKKIKNSELVKIQGTLELDNINPPFKDEKAVNRNKSKYSVVKDSADGERKDYWELDLHIESLTESHRGMSNYDILKVQMDEFKRFFSKAQANYISKIVLIHGVGEGVLKNEIRNHLDKLDFVTFHDASYSEYGKGATEVLIRRKS
jgi:DNA-nicking Smr family endonuclease